MWKITTQSASKYGKCSHNFPVNCHSSIWAYLPAVLAVHLCFMCICKHTNNTTNGNVLSCSVLSYIELNYVFTSLWDFVLLICIWFLFRNIALIINRIYCINWTHKNDFTIAIEIKKNVFKALSDAWNRFSVDWIISKIIEFPGVNANCFFYTLMLYTEHGLSVDPLSYENIIIHQ